MTTKSLKKNTVGNWLLNKESPIFQPVFHYFLHDSWSKLFRQLYHDKIKNSLEFFWSSIFPIVIVCLTCFSFQVFDDWLLFFSRYSCWLLVHEWLATESWSNRTNRVKVRLLLQSNGAARTSAHGHIQLLIINIQPLPTYSTRKWNQLTKKNPLASSHTRHLFITRCLAIIVFKFFGQ